MLQTNIMALVVTTRAVKGITLIKFSEYLIASAFKLFQSVEREGVPVPAHWDHISRCRVGVSCPFLPQRRSRLLLERKRDRHFPHQERQKCQWGRRSRVQFWQCDISFDQCMLKMNQQLNRGVFLQGKTDLIYFQLGKWWNGEELMCFSKMITFGSDIWHLQCHIPCVSGCQGIEKLCE